jgi:myo-inositol-1(or 4)-monophosphatase
MALRSPLINVMVDAAKKAARGLLRDFGEVEQLQVSLKGPADFVSNADRRAEQTIMAELKKARPRFGFLMEEQGVVEGEDTSNRWVIDPLDGTTNFLHGIPHFGISIALERDGHPYAGVIYDSARDEMFFAEKGQGAYLNERRIRVSGRQKLEDAVLTTGIPHRGRPGRDLFMPGVRAFMEVTAGVRRLGSAALDLAWVAAGRCDGYWERSLKAWDVAAGIVIVREAGGIVTDIDGKDDMLANGSILASNPPLHAAMLETLKKAEKDFVEPAA